MLLIYFALGNRDFEISIHKENRQENPPILRDKGSNVQVGLLLDVLGVLVVFKYGWSQPDLSEKVYIIAEQSAADDPEHQVKVSFHKRASVFGLVCLDFGFGLQIVATWMG